ncbi:unnamed protein product [Pylaiella littoralis]
MHPSTSGNRHVRFRDSVDVCGLLGLDRLPLIVLAGICVLNMESPIFACLPGVEGTPTRFVPTPRGGDSPAAQPSGNEENIQDSGNSGGSSSSSSSSSSHRRIKSTRGSGGGDGGENLGDLRDSAWIENYEGRSYRSAASGASAAVARTYSSQCGRYAAALVRFQQEPSHAMRPSLDGAVWPAQERDEVAHLSYGTGPCASPFCRSWGVPSFTLVVFRQQSRLLMNPKLFRDSSSGRWAFVDSNARCRVRREWSHLLGI